MITQAEALARRASLAASTAAAAAEAANAAANAAAGRQSSIFPGAAPVPSATPAPVSRADLLTLEERVARLEKLLADRGIGEDQWLNEG